MLKIHACAGDVYLKGYINIDIEGELAKNSSPCPTTLDNYYQYPFDTTRTQGQIIVDKKMDVTKEWDFEDDLAYEVVLICAIEHFTPVEAKHIVSEAYRVLKSGGKFIIDTPDPIETVTKYAKYPDLMSRLLLCSQKNEHSFHKILYTNESFNELLGDKWTEIKDELVVKHDYPMLGRVCLK